MNKPSESMPFASVEQSEKAPQVELSLNPEAKSFLNARYYNKENYLSGLLDYIKTNYPKLPIVEAKIIAERISDNIRSVIYYDTLHLHAEQESLPIYKYHSFLRNMLKDMFAKEAEIIIDEFNEYIQKKDLEKTMVDQDVQYAAAFDRFFNPLFRYSELESKLHDNNIKKMELSRENQKLPVKNIHPRDQKRKQELNDELMKLAKERKQLEAAQKDAKMLANFVPGFEMDKQEAKKKTEATGWSFEEDKFIGGWLGNNAAEKVAQLRKKLIVDSATRQARYDKKWEKRRAKWDKEKQE